NRILELFEDNKNLINCPHFETIVEQIELSQGKPTQEVLAHIQKCTECSNYFSFWQEMEQVISWNNSQMGKAIISEWEQQQSIQKIKQSIKKKQYQKKLLIWSALSIAAGILFLILALFYFIPATQPPSVQAIEQPASTQLPVSGYSGNSIPYDTAPEIRTPDKDL
ncbi:MAG: hypothetical protein ACP5QY_07895, partial [Candidatus Hydrogenedens sp.]